MHPQSLLEAIPSRYNPIDVSSPSSDMFDPWKLVSPKWKSWFERYATTF